LEGGWGRLGPELVCPDWLSNGTVWALRFAGFLSYLAGAVLADRLGANCWRMLHYSFGGNGLQLRRGLTGHLLTTAVRNAFLRWTPMTGLAALLVLGCCSDAASGEVPSQIIPKMRTIVVPVKEGIDIRFNHLSIKDGLSQTRVEQIVQDDKGFMWFGTQYGLNRYDGYNYKVFTHDSRNPDSLGGVYIRGLFKDRSGALWVACDQVLDRFDPATEKFTHFHLRAPGSKILEPTVAYFSQDNSGVLWLSTSNGLYSLSPSDWKVQRYAHDPNDSSSLSNDDIQATTQDNDGNFWVSTRNGINLFNLTTKRVDRFIRTPDTYADARLHQDRFGTYWVMCDNVGEIGVLDMKTGEITRYLPDPLVAGGVLGRIIYTMWEDREGSMWFGSAGNGLLKFDHATQTFIRYRNHPGDTDSLSANRVNSIFQDHDGKFWIGLHQTEPNFFTQEKPLFQSFYQKMGGTNSLLSSLVTSIYKDHGGDVWIGTTGELQRINRDTGVYTPVRGAMDGTDVLSIMEDKAGVFWYGTTNLGLVRIDPKSGKSKVFRHDPADPSSVVSNLVERLLLDSNGTLWLATWDGLSRFDAKTEKFESYVYDPRGGNENYYAIAEDKSGAIWVGSNVGLEQFNPATKRFKAYRHIQGSTVGLSDSRVNSILFDQSGRAWIGTQNGLNMLDVKTGIFTNYFDRDGLSGNVVSCIQDDKRGHLWMSTNKGISRLDLSTYKFSTYSHEDGLPGDDLTGWGACSKSADGEMFFGGFSGGTAFYPNEVTDHPYVPVIRLTELRVNGVAVHPGENSPLKKALDYTDHITLNHSEAAFSISFAALSYTNVGTNRYRYRLEHLDKGWNEVGSDQRTASYTTLPSGNYIFHVQGATSRGQWSEPGAVLAIQVEPAWWNSWIFRTGYIVCGMGLIVFLYRYRVHQVAQEFKIRLEERLNERTRIARELHDTLMQSFQALVLMFHTAAARIPADHPASEAMQLTLESADKALLEGRDSLRGLRAGVENLDDLGAAFSLLAEELRTRHKARFRVIVEGVPYRLSNAVSGEVYQLGREALINAALHSQATEIDTSIIYSVSEVVLSIRDNGCGIDPRILASGGLEGHWGLIGMRERAKEIGGKFDLMSSSGAGTTVLLKIPSTSMLRGTRKAR
jgi:ligand-binding sensor domain-containing protein